MYGLAILLTATFLQSLNGQTIHAGRYYASAPVFASAPALPPGPAPLLGEPVLPVAAPPIFPAFAPSPLPAAVPAAAPGVVPAMAPPLAASAFGPFGSNKKNGHNPVENESVTEESTAAVDATTPADPNAPKLEVKRTALPELTTVATQPSHQPTQESQI